MNNFIPLTLTAVIAIAMVFAFSPMDYAQTTHAGSTTVSAGSVTAASIAPDTITPIELSATLTLDEATTIGTGAAGLIIDGANGIQIDATDGLVINKILTGSNTMGAGALAEGLNLTVVVTVTGADVTNDIALCTIDTNPDFDELIITNAVITANTVTVTVTNPNLTALDADVVVEGTDVVRCIVFGIQ